MNSINTQALIASGRALQLPATIECSIDGVVSSLEMLEVFRVLPRKRLVCLARWQGVLVVAKLFFAQGRWSQHLVREEQGIKALMNAGVKTADLLARGETNDKACGLLLLKYLDNSENLGARCLRANETEKQAIITKVIGLIAQCHSLGFLQKDIHLNNFLLRNDEIYLLDAGELEQNSVGIDSVNSMGNLAMFLAQFPVSNDALVPALYESYKKQRPVVDWSNDTAVFRALLRKKRAQRLKIILKKLYRETSANAFKRDWNHYIVYERSLESESLQAFLANPDHFIEQGSIIKNGRSATVAIVDIAGTQYVLKRYNIKSLWHRIRRLFRPSRAWVCWRNAHILEMLGITTAKPLLMMEWRFGSLRREAYFLCEYVPGEDALHYLKKEPVDSPAVSLALEQFKGLFTAMRDYSIVHGDMKATNFHINDKGITVLDLDGMYQEPDQRRFEAARQKDLQRFAKNWEDSPELAQLVQQMLQRLREDTDYFTKGS
jgi:tRNA A-37 threonylcarbamoyl transferase component Bud32